MSETHQAITFVGQNIKCDAKGCDFIDNTVTPETFLEWTGRPCPKCGANLLTKDGAEAAKVFLELVGLVNGLVGDLPGGKSDTALPMHALFGKGGLRELTMRRHGGGGA